MVAQADTDVYLEGVEAAANTGEEPNQVWYQTKLGTHVGQCKQRILGGSRSVYAKRSYNSAAPQSRLPLSAGLLCSNAQNVRNRRMPNGTYGGVRGRKTEVGGKLTTFVFLLLDWVPLTVVFSNLLLEGIERLWEVHKILPNPKHFPLAAEDSVS